MGLYLLHFDPAYKHARHYLGFTTLDTEERIRRHVAGHGSPLIRAAIAAGGRVELVRVWPDGDRTLERQLKRGGANTRLCPVCAPGRRARHNARRNPDGRTLVRGPNGRFMSILQGA